MNSEEAQDRARVYAKNIFASVNFHLLEVKEEHFEKIAEQIVTQLAAAHFTGWLTAQLNMNK